MLRLLLVDVRAGIHTGVCTDIRWARAAGRALVDSARREGLGPDGTKGGPPHVPMTLTTRRGRNYTGHTYIGRNYIGHTYIGRNYVGFTYIGRNYMGHN